VREDYDSHNHGNKDCNKDRSKNSITTFASVFENAIDAVFPRSAGAEVPDDGSKRVCSEDLGIIFTTEMILIASQSSLIRSTECK